MAWTMLLPLAASVAMLVGGTSLGRRLPPATAVRLMTATMLATALATGFVLAVAAFTVLAQLPTIAALGRWSVEALRTGDPISVSAGVAAGKAPATWPRPGVIRGGAGVLTEQQSLWGTVSHEEITINDDTHATQLE